MHEIKKYSSILEIKLVILTVYIEWLYQIYLRNIRLIY
jgi:hypothetical protein